MKWSVQFKLFQVGEISFQNHLLIQNLGPVRTEIVRLSHYKRLSGTKHNRFNSGYRNDHFTFLVFIRNISCFILTFISHSSCIHKRAREQFSMLTVMYGGSSTRLKLCYLICVKFFSVFTVDMEFGGHLFNIYRRILRCLPRHVPSSPKYSCSFTFSAMGVFRTEDFGKTTFKKKKTSKGKAIII